MCLIHRYIIFGVDPSPFLSRYISWSGVSACYICACIFVFIPAFHASDEAAFYWLHFSFPYWHLHQVGLEHLHILTAFHLMCLYADLPLDLWGLGFGIIGSLFFSFFFQKIKLNLHYTKHISMDPKKYLYLVGVVKSSHRLATAFRSRGATCFLLATVLVCTHNRLRESEPPSSVDRTSWSVKSECSQSKGDHCSRPS